MALWKCVLTLTLMSRGGFRGGGRAGSGPPFGDVPTYAVSTTPSLTAYVGPSLKGGPVTLGESSYCM